MGIVIYLRVIVFLRIIVLRTDWLEALVHHIDLLIDLRHRYDAGRVIENVEDVGV